MKTCKRVFHWIAFTGVFFLSWGCLEYNIITRVMPNGRILRTIVVKGDSSDIFTGSFHVPLDSTWKITTRYEPRNAKDSGDSEIYVYEANKEFENYNEINDEFYNDSLFTGHNNIKISLEKHFQGFFTRYIYTETYSKLFPFRSIPISNYLSDTELKIHLADDKELFYSPQDDSIRFVIDSTNLPKLSNTDSLRFRAIRDSIEHKFESWQKVNVYGDFYELVIATLKKMKITPDSIASREPFYRWLDSTSAFETGIENDKAFVSAAANFFGVDPKRLNRANPLGFETFYKKFRVAAFTLESYTNAVEMPGKVVKTNADAVGLNSATWTFKIDDFYATEYAMKVESRLVNKWFIALLSIMVVIIVPLLIRRFTRK